MYSIDPNLRIILFVMRGGMTISSVKENLCSVTTMIVHKKSFSFLAHVLEIIILKSCAYRIFNANDKEPLSSKHFRFSFVVDNTDK